METMEEKVTKHSLDSDEENSDDERYDVLQDSDIEGEEEGVPTLDGELKVTPFNLKEELEEGHFDKNGHFHWNKDNQVKDDWLDSIDWVQIKPGEGSRKRKLSDSDSEAKAYKNYDPRETYSKILKMMESHENVRETLQRLGKKTRKLSSTERLKMKKSGVIDNESKLVDDFSSFANEILYRTGNTNIYEESYKTVQNKSKTKIEKNSTAKSELDMYADDFAIKEVEGKHTGEEPSEDNQNNDQTVTWEFKWKQDDSNVHGPFSTEQMQKWTDEEYFKQGVYVRKLGDPQFYQSNRIDFELYL